MRPQQSPDQHVQRLRQTLLENGESPAEAESLANVAHFLRQLDAPEAHDLKPRQLVEALTIHLPRRKTRIERLREWYPVAVLLSQVHIVRRGIWPTSAFAILLGTLITLTTPNVFLFTALA